ncbi:glycosyltransferase [hydrocarbon metagenome]|uniref:Glycosyltransferase n=1 Tax=hydrocarbon metagenome TaxID=938273 RepID=A0A0W8FWD3_9ZZZZ
MGTSNWQQISYCVGVIRDIIPKSILDVGVGFGRWGILSREFLEVWESRNNSKDWKVLIDGIEIFPGAIEDYHYRFYNNIYIADATEFVKKMEQHYDLIILGDVLEHISKEKAEKFLLDCLKKSDYVLLNIPIGKYWKQEEKYGNTHEQHLSFWSNSEFNKFGLIRKKKFRDFLHRKYSVFVLSQKRSNLKNRLSYKEKIVVLLNQYPKTKEKLKRILFYSRTEK